MVPNSTQNPGRSSAPPRFMGLDALRGIAILLVLAFHAWIVRPVWQWDWVHTVGTGAHGVGLFFVVSALTLAASWEHRRHRDRRPRAAFWARRWWRIAPLFYLVLLVAWAGHFGNPQAAPMAMHANVFRWSNLLAHLTFLFGWIPADQNSWIGVEWSIGVEMTFYLLFPWLVSRFVPKNGIGPVLALSVALSLIWPWLLPRVYAPWPHWAQGYPFWSFFTQAPAFVIGLAIYAGRHPREGQWRGWVVAAAAVTAAIAVHHWPLDVSAAAWIFPAAALTYLVWHDLPGVRRLARSRILAYVGTRSYSWYLLHWIILNRVVMRMGPAQAHGPGGFVIRLTVLLALTTVAGELGYRLVERPGIEWGRRWIAKRGWGPQPQRTSQTVWEPRQNLSR